LGSGFFGFFGSRILSETVAPLVSGILISPKEVVGMFFFSIFTGDRKWIGEEWVISGSVLVMGGGVLFLNRESQQWYVGWERFKFYFWERSGFNVKFAKIFCRSMISADATPSTASNTSPPR